MRKKIKVAVAMSGGVDSGVTAALLVKQGNECAGFHLRLWEKDSGLESAEKTAKQLEIPFYKVDFSKVFQKRVIDYFLAEYAAGRTPNPCMMCNKLIKFGELLNYVGKMGFDYLATGHYARIREQKLFQAKDKTKDQSYFLYNLKQEQLAHVLFSIGEYTKKEVRQIAREMELPVAEKPESQEICFLQGNDYRPFLKRNISNSIKSGEVIDIKRRVIGRHFGLPCYTIGQRHGFRITEKNALGPWYVTGKNAKTNQLIVGFGKETEKKEFIVNQISAIGGSAFGRNQVNDLRVRIRHQGELLKCKIRNLNGKIKVILNESERGIAPGQAAVFYKNEEVLGGGIII